MSPNADAGLSALKGIRIASIQKTASLIKELAEYPQTGRGKPSLKSQNLAGFYAGKITDKHRLSILLMTAY